MHITGHPNKVMVVCHQYGPDSFFTGSKEGTLLTPALKGIVIGYWSQVGTLEREHINTDHHNVFIYDSENDSLQHELISTFSYDGQTVIDATESGMLHLIVIGGLQLHNYSL
jgi:hypothetical protein